MEDTRTPKGAQVATRATCETAVVVLVGRLTGGLMWRPRRRRADPSTPPATAERRRGTRRGGQDGYPMAAPSARPGRAPDASLGGEGGERAPLLSPTRTQAQTHPRPFSHHLAQGAGRPRVGMRHQAVTSRPTGCGCLSFPPSSCPSLPTSRDNFFTVIPISVDEGPAGYNSKGDAGAPWSNPPLAPPAEMESAVPLPPSRRARSARR